MSGEGGGRTSALPHWVALTLIILSVALVPNRADHDSWWHLKSGKVISESGLPEKDPLNFRAAGYDWHNHEWLAQLAFYHVWSAGESSGLGGYKALVVFVAVCLWATYAILFWLAIRLSGNPTLALLIIVVAIGIGRRTFYPRPPVISYVFLAGLVAFLTSWSEGWLRDRRLLLALVPLTALWANLHGAWMAGFVVIGAYFAQDLAELLRRRLPLPFEESPPILPPVRWVLLGAALIVASCATPWGYHLYALPARVMGDFALWRSIIELRSPDFYFTQHFEALLILVGLLAMGARGFRPRAGECLVYVFFLHQGIQHVRHLSILSIVMVPMVTRLATAAWIAAEAAMRGRALGAWPRPCLALATAASAAVLLLNPREGFPETTLNTYPARNLQFLRGSGFVPAAFPVEACDYIELAALEGRMFNHNTYAGYLIWRFSPEKHRVFSDPRFDIFGGDLQEDEDAILGALDFVSADFTTGAAQVTRPAWQRFLDRHDVQWMLIRGESPLGGALAALPAGEWRLVMHWPAPGSALARAGWQVWIRDTPGNSAMIERAENASVEFRRRASR